MQRSVTLFCKCFLVAMLEMTSLWAFVPLPIAQVCKITYRSSEKLTVFHNKLESLSAEDEARLLLDRARKIRESLPASMDKEMTSSNNDNEEDSVDKNAIWYRLYVDAGREEGTWMNPTWGASGRRINFTIDVGFTSIPADKDIENKMVRDNLSGSSSNVMVVSPSPKARLRNGFDSMVCSRGGYRIDGRKTVRLYITCSGTPVNEYGDVFVPPGELYFSVPCFMGNVANLSQKEFPVTVRQKGWHTGWYR